MRRSCHAQQTLSRGFSVVELMVAMTLSLILLAGAVSVLSSSKLTFTVNDRMSRVQEAGRSAFELILRDTRPAGFVGCTRIRTDLSVTPHSSNLSNLITNNASLLWNFGQQTYGFEATSSTAWTPSLDSAIPTDTPTPLGGNDVLVLRSARTDSPIFRTNAGMGSATDAVAVDKDSATKLAAGTPVVISDCAGSTIFISTAAIDVGATATIAHGTSGSVTNSQDSLNRTYGIGSQITPVQTVIYYIASCTAVNAPVCPATTGPGLWQIVGNASPQELIQGVEAMQVLYGVDTDGDLLANSYVTANNVTDWTTVVSVNIAVLVRTVDETGTDVDAQTYTLLGPSTSGGAVVGPFNDRRLRRVFTTTITLRNVAT
jgi:type IV pilus assembly protein PilW